MDAVTLIARSMASMTLFALRPFLAAFSLAGAARIGAWAAAADALPTWLPFWLADALRWLNIAPASLLIADAVLALLALLALFEAVALQIDELQPYYEQTAAAARVVTGFVVTFGLVDQQMAQVLRVLVAGLPLDAVGGSGLLSAAFSLNGAADGVLPVLSISLTVLLAALTAFGSWAIGAVRSALGRLLAEIDAEDALGLRGLLNGMDLLTGLAGILLYWYLPLVGLVLALVTLGGLQLARLWLERREDQQLRPCVHCSAPVHRSASACARCRTAQPQVQRIGWFGLAQRRLIRDAAEHHFDLISRRRCPTCAGRLSERGLSQRCRACATVTFANAAALRSYLQRIDRRVPLIVAGCLLCGLIPLIGLVPGLILYRLSLVAALSGYVGASTGCVTRWGVRLLNALLIMLQPFPVIGAVTLPLLCVSNYLIYRTVLLRDAAAAGSFRQ